ncbi:hypothetical protein GOODEAATRI_004135 [Goodea atripinnis]|uniref:LTD domain-containing protein n=1 Tax=Goodea atripinnis TaxID=208336 RepID=A0ABV0PV33_9TELE
MNTFSKLTPTSRRSCLHRNTKKESDLEAAVLRLRDLEAMLNSKDAAYTTALGEKRNLEAEELRESKRRHESRIVEIDSGRQQEFESMLADALTELRAQHEQQVYIYKEELEKTYNSKLDNARHSAERNSNMVGAAHEELQQTRVRLEGMTSQLTQLQKQVPTPPPGALTEPRHPSVAVFSLTEHHLRVVAESLYPCVPPRLRLSPSPSSTKVTVTRSSGSGHGSRLILSSAAAASSSRNSSSASKKRRLNDNDSETSSMVGGTVTKTRISQQASASGRITVDEVDLEGKYIRLNNKADEDQLLGNWQLKRQVGNSNPIIYKFPSKFTLKAGATVTGAHSTSGADNEYNLRSRRVVCDSCGQSSDRSGGLEGLGGHTNFMGTNEPRQVPPSSTPLTSTRVRSNLSRADLGNPDKGTSLQPHGREENKPSHP